MAVEINCKGCGSVCVCTIQSCVEELRKIMGTSLRADVLLVEVGTEGIAR